MISAFDAMLRLLMHNARQSAVVLSATLLEWKSTHVSVNGDAPSYRHGKQFRVVNMRKMS